MAKHRHHPKPVYALPRPLKTNDEFSPWVIHFAVCMAVKLILIPLDILLFGKNPWLQLIGWSEAIFLPFYIYASKHLLVKDDKSIYIPVLLLLDFVRFVTFSLMGSVFVFERGFSQPSLILYSLCRLLTILDPILHMAVGFEVMNKPKD